jgi:hypothetical protein
MLRLANAYVKLQDFQSALSVIEELLVIDYTYQGAYPLWVQLTERFPIENDKISFGFF